MSNKDISTTTENEIGYKRANDSSKLWRPFSHLPATCKSKGRIYVKLAVDIHGPLKIISNVLETVLTLVLPQIHARIPTFSQEISDLHEITSTFMHPRG